MAFAINLGRVDGVLILGGWREVNRGTFAIAHQQRSEESGFTFGPASEAAVTWTEGLPGATKRFLCPARSLIALRMVPT